MTDSDVSCLLSHNRSSWTEIKVEVVERPVPPKATESVFQTPIKTIMPKPVGILESTISTPCFPSVSCSNQPFGLVDNQPTPGFTSAEKDEGTPASTT